MSCAGKGDSMKKEDAGKPCQECSLFNECNAKGDNNQCNMFKVADELLFVGQQLHYFVLKNPIRRFLWKRWKKKAKINLDKYKRLSGRDFEFTEHPYPEWVKDIDERQHQKE